MANANNAVRIAVKYFRSLLNGTVNESEGEEKEDCESEMETDGFGLASSADRALSGTAKQTATPL